MVVVVGREGREREGGGVKDYSYNPVSFVSNENVPVSNCVMALSYRCL